MSGGGNGCASGLLGVKRWVSPCDARKSNSLCYSINWGFQNKQLSISYINMYPFDSYKRRVFFNLILSNHIGIHEVQ